MSRLGWLHTALATAALVLGLGVVLRRKGTRSHRWLGRAYAVCMFGVVGTAFAIYNLYGRFGPFHWAAVISLVTLTGGLVPVLLRRPRRRWLAVHLGFMSYSYIGLVAALASEALTRLPVRRAIGEATGGTQPLVFTFTVGTVSLMIFVVGGVIAHRASNRYVRRPAQEPTVADR